MSKILTLLIPTMKIHSSLALIFPKLKTQKKEFVVGTKEQQVLPHIDMRNRIIIRWGSPFDTEKIPDSITFNSRNSVRIATDKPRARKVLFDAGINVPKMVTPDFAKINYPLIARERLHTLGKNFIVIQDYNTFGSHYNKYAPQGWYYSEYIHKVQEFRVHIGHGKVLSVLYKPKGSDPYNWNRTQTDIPPTPIEPQQWNLTVIKESIKAINALRLDFAGIDVIVDEHGIPYVLELNIKPGMSATFSTQKQYALYFDWLAVSNTRRNHFKIQSNNPEDYAWKESDWI